MLQCLLQKTLQHKAHQQTANAFADFFRSTSPFGGGCAALIHPTEQQESRQIKRWMRFAYPPYETRMDSCFRRMTVYWAVM